MALNPDALTSVANARLFLRDPGADQSTLELMINGYSPAIHGYLGRQLLPLEGNAVIDGVPVYVTKTFVLYDGDRLLDFGDQETELKTLVSVSYDADRVDPPLVIAAADYRLEPRGRNKQGTYFKLSLPRFSPPDGFGTEVVVTGVWGAGVIPPAAEMACLIAVRDSMENPTGAASYSVGELGAVEQSEGSFNRDTAGGFFLPGEARSLLRASGLKRGRAAP